MPRSTLHSDFDQTYSLGKEQSRSAFDHLWTKFGSKPYREEFVSVQVKRGIPLQIRSLLKQQGISQEELANQSGLTQGVVSRAANPNYGNLTLNTIIRIAAGFDVAFIGQFVPFSELGKWFIDFSSEKKVPTFIDEDEVSDPADIAPDTPSGNVFEYGLKVGETKLKIVPPKVEVKLELQDPPGRILAQREELDGTATYQIGKPQ